MRREMNRLILFRFEIRRRHDKRLRELVFEAIPKVLIQESSTAADIQPLSFSDDRVTVSYTHLDVYKRQELKQIFSPNFPEYSESDFYEMEVGSAGLMRSYMARKCDIHFPLDHKLSRFLTAAMRIYKVPEEEQEKVLCFVAALDIKSIATAVMQKLFAMLEMKFDFKLSKDGETEGTR